MKKERCPRKKAVAAQEKKNPGRVRFLTSLSVWEEKNPPRRKGAEKSRVMKERVRERCYLTSARRKGRSPRDKTSLQREEESSRTGFFTREEKRFQREKKNPTG